MTGRVENFNGISLSIPNDVPISEKEFYISFNNQDADIYGGATTALVAQREGNPIKFLILNGNHVKKYKDIVANGGGYVECVKYFKENLDQKSKYSENWDEILLFADGEEFRAIKDISLIEAMKNKNN